jgi:hypothetical protein
MAAENVEWEKVVASADRYGSGIFDIQERGDRSPRIMLV